ncbi:MAG: hypothetical protein DRO36_06390, partial [Candidatus Hecatellales archaeon]
GYTFKFKKFKEPVDYTPPKGVQTFFLLTPSMIKKRLKTIKFEFLGTCAENHFPIDDCECDQCQDPKNKRRKHSSLLIDDKIMIDAGTDWKKRLPKIDPLAIILTHLHPDHAGALEEVDKRYVVHISSRSLKAKDGVKLDEKLKIIEHKDYEEFKIGLHTFKFVPVYHSTVCPTSAVVIDDVMIYAPDFLGFKKNSVLRNKVLFIGDGSSVKRDIKRPNNVGHMSMFNQIRLCSRYGVKHVKFTHVGHVYITHEDLKDTLRIMAKEEGHYPNPNDVYVAEDGDTFVLRGDDILEKDVEKRFLKPNKPMWRIFEPEDIFDLRGFKLPAVVEKKVDGMRSQLNTDDGTIRSEDKGYDKKSKFRLASKELKEKYPNGTILDAEGVEVVHGQPLHRTSIIGYADGEKYIPEKDANSQFWIFDVLMYEGKDLRDLPYSERLRYLKKLPTTEHLKPMKISENLNVEADGYIVKTRKQLLKAIEKVRKMKGSEGAMIKTLDGRYLKYDTQNPTWVKLKNLKEVDCIVVDIDQPKHQIGPKKGKPIEGVYNYHVAVGPYSKECAKIVLEKAPKGKAVEFRGKVYAYLGKTFNTSIKAPLGGIIRVWSPEINKYPIEGTNCAYYGIFQPRVLEWVREKDVPDKIAVVERLSKLTLPRTVKKYVKITEEEYLKIRKKGEPLPPQYYKWQPKCKKCRGVLQRHYPTGKLIPIPKGREGQEEEELEKVLRQINIGGKLVKGEYSEEELEKLASIFPGDLIVKFRDHCDLRMEVNDILIGVTPHPPVPKGKTSWDVFKERVENNQRIECSVKYPHPKAWLNKEGEVVFPTLHQGAKKLSVGKMEIKDRFIVKYGVQRKNLHEYFFKGGKVLNGRFVLRVILVGKDQRPTWILIKPEDQYPLNPVEHKDEGYWKIIRDEDLTKEMARSPVRD